MQTLCNKDDIIYAGFFCRLAAFLIDSVLVGIAISNIKLIVWIIHLMVGDIFLFQPILFTYTIFDIIYYLLSVSYFVIMTYYSGATVGKQLMKIKVTDTEGQKLSLLTVLLRETVGRYLSALIIYVGYIIVGVDNRKQGLHDKIADTCVIYKHEECERKQMPQELVEAVN